MFYNRSAAVAAAFVVALASPVLLAASASAGGPLPWAEQTVFALGPTDNYVAEWNGPGQGWTEIGGPASAVYAGSAGVFATNPSSGDIFEYNGTPGSWSQIGGPGEEFAEGGGHLYGSGRTAATWPSGTARDRAGASSAGPWRRSSPGPDGLVATAPGTAGDIWRYNGNSEWTDIGGPEEYSTLVDIAVGVNGVYRVDPVNSSGQTVVAEWTGGTTWTPILTVGSGQTPSSLVAGYAGVYVDDVTSTSDWYLEYSGTPNSWSQVSELDYYGTGIYPLVESATSLYGVTLDPQQSDSVSTNVEIYSGSGTSWTVIGGPAALDPAAGA